MSGGELIVPLGATTWPNDNAGLLRLLTAAHGTKRRIASARSCGRYWGPADMDGWAEWARLGADELIRRVGQSLLARRFAQNSRAGEPGAGEWAA